MNLPPAPSTARAVVYFFHDLEGHKVKIGHTKALASREAKIRTDNGNEVVLLGTIPGGRREEACLHELFDKQRVRYGGRATEWFRDDADLLDTIRYLVISRGVPRTVQDELDRRNGCRYGLGGVRVALRRRGCVPHVILRSRWNACSRLVVDLCLADEFPAGERPRSDPWVAGAHGGRPCSLTLSIEEILANKIPDPASTIQGVPATDCFLLSDWPVICRCWCDDTED